MPILTTQEQQDLIKRHQELIRLVHNMRVNQARYFKTRNSLYLNESKKLEKKVDDFLEQEIEKERVEQGKMF